MACWMQFMFVLPFQKKARHVAIFIFQSVEFYILRHLPVIDASYKLPPSQDLSNKPLDAIDRGFPTAVLFHRRMDRLPRIEQFEVQRDAEAGVVEERFSGPHRVFVSSEVREAVLDKIMQRLFRLNLSSWHVEVFGAAGMVGEALLHHRDHRIIDCVVREALGRLNPLAEHRCPRPLDRQRLAVLFVEVPLPADGFDAAGFPRDQHVMPPALPPVKILHHQR